MYSDKLINRIFGQLPHDMAYYEKIYPKRKENMVVRFAPSPTGFLHTGSLYTALINYKLAYDNKGVFYLRIEDTDTKRTVEGSLETLKEQLNYFGIEYNNDPTYAPYMQSQRKDIYNACLAHMLKEGLAYPCFLTEEEIKSIRNEQEASGNRTGIYGVYAKYRDIKEEDAIKLIDEGHPYVIRLKSNGDFNKRFKIVDLLHGELSLPENDFDIVIYKNDKLPTYHFAHLVDDHLMRTTHVVRGQEWMSSVPVHYELFKTFGFKMPKYIHTPLILKKDGDKIRKISKRLDPEARMTYYEEKGYPVYSLIEAIMTIANSNYEQWREGHPDADFTEFEFSPKKMSSAGALFDLDKLDNISKNYLSKLKATEVFDGLDEWSKVYDTDFNALINKHKDYTISVLNIEREQKKPRKDFACFSEVKDNIWYMYNELFDGAIFDFSFLKHEEDAKKIISTYLNEYFDINDDKDTWFNKIKELTEKMGYCSNMKEYKENPDNYKGSTADISNVIRVALTTKLTTPDLYEIINILGDAEVRSRFSKICG